MEEEEEEEEYVPDGYYKCQLCGKWISVFPARGQKKSRYYAQQHCLSLHFQQMIWECDTPNCSRHKTKTWKAMYEHQMRRHGHRVRVIRLVRKQEEKETLAQLVDVCFPQVPFPPPPSQRAS